VARSQEEHRSATLADVFAHAGPAHEEDLLASYRDFWEPHTITDPEAPDLLDRLLAEGLGRGRARGLCLRG
jgi:putative hydrolase of the HAD superfamily